MMRTMWDLRFWMQCFYSFKSCRTGHNVGLWIVTFWRSFFSPTLIDGKIGLCLVVKTASSSKIWSVYQCAVSYPRRHESFKVTLFSCLSCVLIFYLYNWVLETPWVMVEVLVCSTEHCNVYWIKGEKYYISVWRNKTLHWYLNSDDKVWKVSCSQVTSVKREHSLLSETYHFVKILCSQLLVCLSICFLSSYLYVLDFVILYDLNL